MLLSLSPWVGSCAAAGKHSAFKIAVMYKFIIYRHVFVARCKQAKNNF